MRTQKNSQRFFRIFAAMIVFVMAFSQAAGVANAQNAANPPVREKTPISQANLDEVLNYYGRLGDVKGPVGIVVEMTDTPAALVFDKNQGQAQSAQATIDQTNLIEKNQASFISELQKAGIKSAEIFRAQKAYNGIWMRVDTSALKTIAALPGVKAIHPIISKTLDHTTSVPLIGAPQVWGGSGTYQGTNIKIGIIDTGIDYAHTNFAGPGVYVGQDFTTLNEVGNLFPTAKVVGGWDFVGDAYNADPSSPSYDPIPVPDADPMDCNGHGSHVAGSAAGFGVNADGTTYAEAGADTYAALKDLTSNAYVSKFRIGPGVAPKADLYALRVFGCDGSTDVVVSAIEWAMDPNNDGDLSDHLDVINMSLGSSYGSVTDPDAIASDNAAKAGVIVVASAGNSGDVYYVTGSPAVAPYAISVANSVDSSAVLSAFEVQTNTAPSPLAPAGKYPASTAVFGPQSYNVPGDLAYLTTTDLGCAAYPAGTFTGKIALINRGTCSFDVKVTNAQNAGAIGVLIANNTDAFPGAMGASGTVADPTIPAMMTTKSVGTSLKADMLAGTVNVLLTTAFPNSVFMSDPTVTDNVSSSSSRGPARGGTMLKPDIAAPGDTIFSTATGTGNKGDNFSGTSMAAPHISGVMALLRQIHPDWTVAELKALAMNTATNDLFTGPSLTGTKYTPTRVGAGRVNVPNAALSNVVAYYKNNPGQVNVSFGFVEVVNSLAGIDKSIVKSITLSNLGGSTELYNVTFDSRYAANPGLTFTLLNAGNTAISNPVTVPAYGTIEIKVKVDLDAAALTRARDTTISTASSRERFSEGGGYVVLTSTGVSPMVRVPVHIAARPASDMGVVQTSLTLPAAASGTLSLTPSGIPVDTADDGSLVYITELKGESPNEPSSTFSNNAADLKYIGAISDYTTTVVGKAAFFSIATYGDWDTLSAVEFDIYIDIDEDGVDDYVLYNTNTGGTDTMVSVLCSIPSFVCGIEDFINWFGGGSNTNTFNNNVMTMNVYLEDLGLAEGVNTDFDFYVVSFTREAAGAVDVSDIMHYDVANQSFTTNGYFGTPAWDDNVLYAPTLDINYDKSNIAANHSTGLLLLHQHNAVNTAEVLTLVQPTVLKDTAGVFRPSNGLLYLKNTNSTGVADVAINYGTQGDYPVVGDWDGNGTDTIGVYRDGSFYLRNSNTVGFADIVFVFGEPGDQPIAGDWDGNGTDTIGVYRSSTGEFFLRNSNTAGAPDSTFSLGNPGDVGIAGDWNGDGLATTGVFRPSNGALYLKNTNATGFADIAINYGLPGDQPVTGDWNNDGLDTIGIYRGGSFYLRNSNTPGVADIVFALGNPGDMPIAGNWDGLP